MRRLPPPCRFCRRNMLDERQIMRTGMQVVSGSAPLATAVSVLPPPPKRALLCIPRKRKRYTKYLLRRPTCLHVRSCRCNHQSSAARTRVHMCRWPSFSHRASPLLLVDPSQNKCTALVMTSKRQEKGTPAQSQPPLQRQNPLFWLETAGRSNKGASAHGDGRLAGAADGRAYPLGETTLESLTSLIEVLVAHEHTCPR